MDFYKIELLRWYVYIWTSDNPDKYLEVLNIRSVRIAGGSDVLELIDHVRDNMCESTDALEVYWDRLSAIQTTQISPQQHLAEIRAQAVEQFALHVSDNMDDGIDRAKLIILASERIYSIRRGEVE